MWLSRRTQALPSLLRSVWPNPPLLRPLQHAAGRGEEREASRGGGEPGLSVRQKRIGSQLRAALCHELQNGPMRDQLLQTCGFCIHEVRMSDDLRTAHILWSAFGGHRKEADKHLRQNMNRLRSSMFEQLALPFSPFLQFCEYTEKSAEQKHAFDQAFEKINSEKEPC